MITSDQIKIAMSMSKKYGHVFHIPIDFAIDASMEALVLADRSYEEGKGCTYNSYICRCIHRAIARVARHEHSQMREHTSISLDSTFLGQMVHNDSFEEDILNKVVVTRAWNWLTQQQRALFIKRFWYDMTFDEIASEMGKTRQHWQSTLKQTLQKVNRRMRKMDALRITVAGDVLCN